MAPKKVRIFVRRELQALRVTYKELDQIIRDFEKYKGGKSISYFGRDVPYHEPRPNAENAGIRHVHILEKVKAVKFRTDTSDSALVYAEASMHPDTYYVIDFLAENAHGRANSQAREPDLGDKTYINWVIEKAEEFRERF